MSPAKTFAQRWEKFLSKFLSKLHQFKEYDSRKTNCSFESKSMLFNFQDFFYFGQSISYNYEIKIVEIHWQVGDVNINVCGMKNAQHALINAAESCWILIGCCGWGKLYWKSNVSPKENCELLPLVVSEAFSKQVVLKMFDIYTDKIVRTFCISITRIPFK